MTAMRDNKGKPQMSFLLDFPHAAEGLARVFEFGAIKYERHNWKRGFPSNKLVDSMLRHLMKWANGEDVDQDPLMNGCLHLDEVVWNAIVLAEQARTHPELDERIKKAVKEALSTPAVAKALGMPEIIAEETALLSEKKDEAPPAFEEPSHHKLAEEEDRLQAKLAELADATVDHSAAWWPRGVVANQPMRLTTFHAQRYNPVPILNDRNLELCVAWEPRWKEYAVYVKSRG